MTAVTHQSATTTHAVDVSHKHSDKRNTSYDDEEKDNEELLRKAANASKD